VNRAADFGGRNTPLFLELAKKQRPTGGSNERGAKLLADAFACANSIFDACNVQYSQLKKTVVLIGRSELIGAHSATEVAC
jgi:hypothetical protein